MKLRTIIESGYEGLEDADAFSEPGWDETCSFCGNLYFVEDPENMACHGCGKTICPDCEIASIRMPDGVYDNRVYCSDECRRNLYALEESDQGPIIRRVQWSPAAIYIQFPNGETWEYVVYENRWLQDILRSHRRNVGRVVAALKKLNAEARRVS